MSNKRREWIKEQLGEIYENALFIDRDFFISKICVKYDCTSRTAKDDLRVVILLNPDLKEIFNRIRREDSQRKL